MRTLQEIQDEYAKTCAHLGQEVHNSENEIRKSIEKAQRDSEALIINLKSKITALKKEADKRREADAKAGINSEVVVPEAVPGSEYQMSEPLPESEPNSAQL